MPQLKLQLMVIQLIKLVLKEQQEQLLHWLQPQLELRLKPFLQVIVEPQLMLVTLV